jgi:hypothetical protein
MDWGPGLPVHHFSFQFGTLITPTRLQVAIISVVAHMRQKVDCCGSVATYATVLGARIRPGFEIESWLFDQVRTTEMEVCPAMK